MSAKIGLIGGVGWPATVAYYEAICRQARAPETPGSPALTIESLDMAETLAARGKPGDEASWHSFDTIFRDAIENITRSGCDLAAIASVTPHVRLPSITQNAKIPIVSILDATVSELLSLKPRNALILGTRITMEGSLFDAALSKCGCSKIETSASDAAKFAELLDAFFYQGRFTAGRDALLEYIEPRVHDPDSMVIVLACTDIGPAFPEIEESVIFEASGYRFLDTTSAHIAAILRAAEQLADSASSEIG
ncbi:Asp/Glu racemase [Rhodobacterales bacterium HKCCSP123]|nr:Asp/Glu racemase [Rhodobacterales bacterium HKCCSP123]